MSASSAASPIGPGRALALELHFQQAIPRNTGLMPRVCQHRYIQTSRIGLYQHRHWSASAGLLRFRLVLARLRRNGSRNETRQSQRLC